MDLDLDCGFNTNLRDIVVIILGLLKPFLCYLDLSVTVLDERLKVFHLLIKIKIKLMYIQVSKSVSKLQRIDISLANRYVVQGRNRT